MATPRVLQTNRLPASATAYLRAHAEVEVNESGDPLPPQELRRRAAAHDGVVCLLTDRFDAQLIGALPTGFKVIANVAVGYDNIDVAAASSRGIMVTNTPGVLTETTADLAWALLMAAARRLVEADRYVRAGRFRRWELMDFLGCDVHGATLGIIGMGRIGQAVARRARGFAMRLIYHNRRPLPAPLEQELAASYVPLETLLGEADFISLHVPLTPQTHHLIGMPELRRMKPTACLINTARGPVVDEAALVIALRDGCLGAAALDVYEREPALSPGLAELPQTVLLPHLGSASRRTRERMARMAAENCVAALRGERPPNLVNPEAFRG
ncbi:MAG: D-glycerate dehydrogenase [Candidatus Tectomicrobia bacterium]|nr:D-glycerate dehydrogenase [Candidatus Tectomicrobia bacterium]